MQKNTPLSSRQKRVSQRYGKRPRYFVKFGCAKGSGGAAAVKYRADARSEVKCSAQAEHLAEKSHICRKTNVAFFHVKERPNGV